MLFLNNRLTLFTSLFVALAGGVLSTRCYADLEKDVVLDADQLSELSLEELTKVKVTSASKKEQKLNDVASAVFVITQSDIQRSTATVIPELLRMVPGLYVAQIGASTWSIASRGLGGLFSNKLLVLIDGRTVYTPLYSGTYWEVQDYPLNDIERIEVIRGPGGTVWGSNAVNGVINIITKSAASTEGGAVSLQSGKEALGVGNIRYGWKEDDTAFSTYARGRLIDNLVREEGSSSADGYNSVQGGFKFSQALSSTSEFGMQGDIYSLNRSERLGVVSPTNLTTEEVGQMAHSRGGNVLARLKGEGVSEGDTAAVQFYYDQANREEAVGRSKVSTIDLDVQYDLAPIHGHGITVGGGVRTIRDTTGFRKLVTVDPPRREYSLVNLFIQDDYKIIPDTWSITGGVKFEHNEFTGGVWQPSLKSSWHATDELQVWGSVSRAVRIPSRVENDVYTPLAVVPPSEEVPVPTLIELHGSRDTEPEVALSYEVGLRSELSTDFALDLAGFYTDYKNLATLNRATPEFFMSNGGPAIRQPLIVNNDGDAGIWGIETVVEGKLSASSRIQLWHVLQIIDVSTRNSVGDPNFLGQSNNNPVNQIALRSQFDIGNSMELNSMVRFVESVPSVNASSYWQADLQLAWRVAKDLRLTLNGSNLLSNDHEESSSELLIRPLTRVERSYFVGLGYSF